MVSDLTFSVSSQLMSLVWPKEEAMHLVVGFDFWVIFAAVNATLNCVPEDNMVPSAVFTEEEVRCNVIVGPREDFPFSC